MHAASKIPCLELDLCSVALLASMEVTPEMSLPWELSPSILWLRGTAVTWPVSMVTLGHSGTINALLTFSYPLV